MGLEGTASSQSLIRIINTLNLDFEAEETEARRELRSDNRTSAANRLIGEVVQSRRRPLLLLSWLKVPTSAFTFKTLLRHYA